MRKLAIGLAAAMALGTFVNVSRAADEPKKVSGILIDESCAAKFTSKANPEEAAAAHPVACCLKCGKDGDFVLLSGKKELKLDKHGKELAMAYLAKADAKTHVTITGDATDTEIKVKSIDEAKASSKD
jgi:hypothetical protein